MTASHRRHPQAQSAREPELLFCANCQVSVALIELERGTAKRTPRGRIFCSLCTRAGPVERATRRQVLEQEFADDAPTIDPAPEPAPIPTGVSTEVPAVAQPVHTNPRLDLDDRVGQLERTVLRMQEQLHRVERQLETRTDG